MVSGRSPQLFNVTAADSQQVAGDLLRFPAPLADAQQALNVVGFLAHADHAGGISGDNGIGRYVAGHAGLRRDHRTVAHIDTGQDGAVPAGPDIVADDRVATVREVGFALETTGPGTAEDQ